MAKRRKGRPLNGVVLVDKPSGYSSNGLLQKVRWLYQAQKAGHTGALDPAATGLLPVCFGEATKFTQFLLDANKRYVTTGVLGATTDTLDSEGEVTEYFPVPDISTDELAGCLATRFVGAIQQIPPMYSALKRDGKKLYELAREGKTIDLKARPVTIYGIELLGMDMPEFTIDVQCSKGTYIRTLVADIGTALGSGAYVKTLRRTEHGRFSLQQAVTLDQLIALQEAGNVEAMDQLIIPMDELLSDYPAIELNEKYSLLFGNGNDVHIADDSDAGMVRVYDFAGDFMGLGLLKVNQRLYPQRLVNRQH
ncbi:MAG: tRNA pseudouridine(55) synthase TruB [Reinekea sp.]